MSQKLVDLNKQFASVTHRIIERSAKTRKAYLDRMARAKRAQPPRSNLPCGNFAHGIAACSEQDKLILKSSQQPNIAIVTAYNDMLSAHQPYFRYPPFIKKELQRLGGVAQVAGGVPAMCDGVTQGQPGMEMSLFSREVIAMATAVAFSHNMFDGGLMLGICDKIVPGMLIGALSFGYLPIYLVPAGPMPSGLANKDKAKVRQKYALGEVDRDGLLEAETASYHSSGTCTFYGTANTNQMMVEMMGLQLPGSSFVNPDSPLRDKLTASTCEKLYQQIEEGNVRSLCDVVSEKSLVNAIVGLLATGGSTNHTLHILTIAKAAGISISWRDMSELSEIVPLLARVYPNGEADVNHFHNAGGMGFIIKQLLEAGLLHNDVLTLVGEGLEDYCKYPLLETDKLSWKVTADLSGDSTVLRKATEPFQADGGLKLLEGNLGQAVIKSSAVQPENRQVTAPARVFTDQNQVTDAFNQGDLEQDAVVVLVGQGPKANGMPELHKLTPVLGALQDKGFKVAIVTDGRMSGASGKVPAAIHVSPEACSNGNIGKVRNGDIVTVDAVAGVLKLHLTDAELEARDVVSLNVDAYSEGCGRELFAPFRQLVGGAEEGATVFANFLLDE